MEFVRSVWAVVRGHKLKFISCFCSMCESIFSSYLTYSDDIACTYNVYTTCTQWFHHPNFQVSIFWLFRFRSTRVCICAQTLPSITHFAVCTLFQLWFQRKAGALVVFKLFFFVTLNKSACALNLSLPQLVMRELCKWLVGPEIGK